MVAEPCSKNEFDTWKMSGHGVKCSLPLCKYNVLFDGLLEISTQCLHYHLFTVNWKK